MRKTFLKVALIGLLVGSLPVGFTSCKDYDDDIEQTNDQVADLKTKLASVETAIAALPSKADVTAAQAAAVAQAKADLEAVKAELQKAIDGKADKEAVEAINTELSSIKGQLETIEALKGQVTEAMDAINASIEKINEDAVAKGQMIAGLEGQIADLKKAQEEGATNVSGLADELTALKAAVEDPTSGIAALKTQIEELAKQINGAGGDATSLEAVVRLMNGMITHIEVVNNPIAAFDNKLNLFVVDVKEDRVFGEGLPGEITFTKDQEMLISDSLLVRVSPANAVVTADQIQLVNTKGEDMSSFISVTEVKPYEGLLTSRSIANNGLHVVKLELKKGYDREAYKTATSVGEKNDKENILFAVAIADNEKELADNRDVTSSYNVVIKSDVPDPSYNLYYGVNETTVYNIKNRFESAFDGSSFAYAENLVTLPANQDWAPMDEAYKYGQDVNNLWSGGFTNVGDYYYQINDKKELSARWANSTPYGGNQNARADWRQNKPTLPVELGKKFTVDLAYNNPGIADGIYGFYVALDMLRATESNGSERTAWKAYEPLISGINKVIKGTTVDLCLNMKDVEPGEVIGFRVWAVNYNGTLVDPDGRAFYVQVGETEAKEQGEVSFTLTATNTLPVFLGDDDLVDGTDQLKGDWMNKYSDVTALFEMDEVDEADGNPQYNGSVELYLKGEYISQDKNNPTTLWRNAQAGYDDYFGKMNVALTSYNFIDGATYTGKLRIYANNSLVQTIAIKFVKNIPTTMPANAFSVKPGQSTDDGKINAYVDKDVTSFDLNEVFNFGDNMSESIIYAATDVRNALNGVIPVKVNPETGKPAVVNTNAYYTLNLVYTYYGVSYVWRDDLNRYGNKNVEIKNNTYSISFNTLSNQYNFAWGVANKVSLAPALVQGKANKVALTAIDVTSSMQVDLKSTLSKLVAAHTVTIVNQPVGTPKRVAPTFDSNLAPYFTVTYNEATDEFEFDPVPGTNPVGKITGTLSIPYVGSDGITCVKTLAVTMNAPQK